MQEDTGINFLPIKPFCLEKTDFCRLPANFEELQETL